MKSSDIMLTRVSLAANHSPGTSELCQGQEGQKTSWQEASSEAKASGSREKRVDESGKERVEQSTRFSVTILSRRNTENVLRAAATTHAKAT